VEAFGKLEVLSRYLLASPPDVIHHFAKVEKLFRRHVRRSPLYIDGASYRFRKARANKAEISYPRDISIEQDISLEANEVSLSILYLSIER
jgi:hypothetical protein